jgi:pimeloyl-ACP methyl ester carboxylesterase
MIYTLPGMGANSNMYSGPWLEIQNIKFLDWPIYHGEKTLSEVADRIISENNICQSDSVAGSSLGGMVALEIANKLRVENVFLFGSAVAITEINPLLRLLSPIAEVTPIKFIQTIAGKFHNKVFKMFSTSDSDFIRSMCHEIYKWQGFNGDQNIIKRIHGEKDKIITCHSKCKTIKNGGHLIAVTHAHQCIEILKHINH